MPLSLDRQLIERLREDLASLGPLDALFTGTANSALRRDELTPARIELTDQTGPEATVARLFFFGDSVSLDDVDEAFPECRATGLVELRVLEPGGDGLTAAVDLSPVELDGITHWFASDSAGGHLASDHVVGVGHASLTLAGITDRTPRRYALDLGTGGGIQAAGLAAHCEKVVATDLSSRALTFAAFNAALAGFTRIGPGAREHDIGDDRAGHDAALSDGLDSSAGTGVEKDAVRSGLAGATWDLREGSMFDPVAGERFDLIVSNPPFVITPAAAIDAGLARYEYRDAGQSGDRLFLDLISDLHEHLAPGGSAQMLGNWEHRDGERFDRLAEAAVGLDLWVIEREVLDPAEYVEMWLRDGGMPDGDSRERAYAAWIADFADRGVTAVGFGYVLARPQSGATPIRRFETVTGPVSMPIGDHLAACFDALQRDGDIANLHLRVAEDVTIERHYRPFAEEPTAIVARQGGGLSRTILLSTALAGLFSAADGDLTAGQIAVALESLLGEDGLAERVLNEAAEAHEWGLLVTAD